MPGLHVVAAGSLLEFALSEIPSFGVGRITSLYMHPLSFLEFLDADGRHALGDAVRASSAEKPLEEPFHEILMDRLRAFLLVGGMPEAVKIFLETGDFTRVTRVHDDLINGYRDDFAKYKKLVPATRLQEVLASVAAQTGGKFKYVSIGNERAAAYKQALDLLILAGLAHPVYHTSARGVPLGAQIDPKKFKVMIFDTGIFQRLSGLDIPSHVSMTNQELVNKGALAELHVALELVKQHSPFTRVELYYWHRESRSSNAEVDFVLQTRRGIVPVEVKSGVRGAMQSMRIFLEERKLEKGVRVSSEPFGRVGNIDLVPLYAAGTLLS
jgi:predicted AAA+ superfamily ATPase